MKKPLLSLALPLLMAAAAHAQVIVVDRGRELQAPGRRCGTTSGWGYGYTYGYGYGYGGFTYGSPGSLYTYVQGPVLLGGYGYGGLYGGMGYYGGYGYRGAFLPRPSASADAAGPVSRPGPVADRLAEFASVREMEEGRNRLKSGDYRGAVDQFRAAVAARTESPLAQAWFAVALAIVGDGRNADKALRAATSAGFPADRMSLADAFRDEKERAKVTAALGRMSGDGALSAAFALSLAGEGARLKDLAEKDPVARKLLSGP